MYKIDTKKLIVDKDNVAFDVDMDRKEKWTIGEYLYRAILNYSIDGAMKKYRIADKIIKAEKYASFEIEDMAFIKSAENEFNPFKDSPIINTIFKGQVQIYLEELKDTE